MQPSNLDCILQSDKILEKGECHSEITISMRETVGLENRRPLADVNARCRYLASGGVASEEA